MKEYVYVSLFIGVVAFCIGCREPFEPEVSGYHHNILVVEGYIEVGGGESHITLGRTRPIYDPVSIFPEGQAAVNLESEGGESWTFGNYGGGNYALSADLPENQNYRLRISTPEGRSYLSDEIVPVIASESLEVTYEKKDGDVYIYANTFGTDDARYFIWEYEETWVYRSAFRSSYKYVNGTGRVVPRTAEEMRYKCWGSDYSKGILIASSERYEGNHIYQNELLIIDSLSEKLGERYSVNVKQRAIDLDAFVFWEAIRKNSADIGGIFSPLPSLVSGNIHSVDRPDEPVIGHISAGKSVQKRIYINRTDVHPWQVFIPEYRGCSVDTVAPRDYADYFGRGTYLPVHENCVEAFCSGYIAAPASCADCTYRGGTVEQPDFWEEEFIY